MRFHNLCLLLTLLSAVAWCSRAHAQVRHCTMPDGATVYTDRVCADIGAKERPPQTSSLGTVGARAYRGGCARNLRDLAYEMTSAIDANDVNRLAGLYHWVGASSSSAAALMDRLEVVAHRPLVDIIPVAAPSQGADAGASPDSSAQSTVRRPPVGLRVEQTLANASTPSRTVFGLRRYLDCWWITL